MSVLKRLEELSVKATPNTVADCMALQDALPDLLRVVRTMEEARERLINNLANRATTSDDMLIQRSLVEMFDAALEALTKEEPE